MHVAMLTPLPPAKTGVAHYASLLIPALAKVVDLVPPTTNNHQPTTIYQLGNNPFHEPMYREAMRTPGIVVLHDLVLHHLIVEMTLARGDVDGYVRALRASHGEEGAAWAIGRAHGLHSEMGNFLLPASIEVAQRSLAVIVHNHYAANRLRAFGVTTPIHVVPHPYVPETRYVSETNGFDRDGLRARYGFTREHRVIGFFGFLTSAKRADVVLDAFRIARETNPNLALLVVGEPSPNIDVASLQRDGITMTGYVSDDDFPAYYAVADRFVNLRYPSAGETSGTLIRALDAGKPVAVSDYAQFAEFPDDCVFKVPLGDGEVERLVEFFTSELPDPSRTQRAWLEANATLEKTVEGYLRALQHAPRVDVGPRPATIPLFPQLEVLSADASVRIAIRNIGPSMIQTRTYGSPEYRLIAKLFDGETQIQDRWLSLPCDLRPNETAEITFAPIAKPTSIRLYHALQDIPMLEPEAWEIVDVR
ncbi:MAG: glycosyltransferase family 4 protein [Thermoanaerobaculia bacterium]